MPLSRADRAIPVGLSALAVGLALLQRPGRATSETKIDLHVDPVGFLGDVASAWSPSGDLGHVQGGQYGGYLLPMGPFFALGRLAGGSPWLVQRLWLGAVLALAAWGTVRLMDALAGRPRGVAHAVAGLLVVVCPYVAVFTGRTSVTLLGLAALPWLLLCVHRGVRAPRSWWWPAAFAVTVTLMGGGVNAAVVAWILLGPVALALYELLTGAAHRRALLGFAGRTALATALASVWWVVPLLVQARHGVDFLGFTEQPGTIWSTTSLAESLRQMGYWISYLGVGYGGDLRPYQGSSAVMLFAAPVVLAGLLIPALALGGLVWTRRWAYGPFFAVLVLLGLVVMAAGFPEGTPLRRAITFTYNHVALLQFLRTTYKAGPLVVLGVACLGGMAAAAAAARLRGRRVALAGGGAVLVALALVSAWPLTTGRALDPQLTWEEIPSWWKRAAAHVDRRVAPGERAVVLPGQLYAAYDWGGTVDPIAPALAERPVAVRSSVPYGDLRSIDLLWTLDALVSQRRALPGQLGPLLDLFGARVVLTGADDDRTRSGAVPPAEAAGVLRQLGPPDAAWGPREREPRAAGRLGAALALPRVRAWDRPSPRPGLRLAADGPATVVDGSAEGLAGLAALGALPRDGRRLLYAADLAPGALRAAARGGEVVVSDSNRRQVIVPSRFAQNRGPVLAPEDPISEDAARLDPFPARGADAQTVALYEGIGSVRSPSSPGFPQFPESRPFAALDGNPRTGWLADRALARERHWLEVAFERPRDVAAIDLLPYSDRRGAVRAVEVAGRRFAVRRGWNRLRLGLRGVRSLRVRIAAVSEPEGVAAGAGGIRELRIPGVRARESLRPPVLAERALAGAPLDRTGLTYLFARTTGDDPLRRDPRRGTASARLVRDRLDAERGLERSFAPPAARAWRLDGWATVDSRAPDPALDRLAGVRGGAVLASSGRFEGRPGHRASSAFDGTGRAWIGSWIDGRRAWLQWRTRRPATVREFRLAPARERVRRPTSVRLRWAGGGATPALAVGPGGRVVLPRPVRARAFRLEVLAAAWAPGTPGRIRQRRAVGIGELTGPGVPRVRVPRAGALRSGCGALAGRVGARRVVLQVEGDLAALDAGRPLRARGCGALVLPAGPARLSLPARTFAPRLLRLRSAAPGAAAPRAAAPGRIADAGAVSRGARTGIRLELDSPAWLVLGQAFSTGWEGRCDGRSLGAPVPVDAASMAWRVPAGCERAELAFAPDGAVRAGYGVSAVALLILIALLVLRRPPALREPATAVAALPDSLPRRLPAGRAAAFALPAGLALGFVFAARATPLFALGAFLVLWRGIGARELVLAATALLAVAVPVLTLAIGVEDRGGYNPEYASERIAVHWAAVAGVALLILAAARMLSTARGRPPAAPAGAPPGAPPPPRAP